MKKRTLLASLFLALSAWFCAAPSAEACMPSPTTYNQYIFRAIPYNNSEDYSKAVDCELAAEWSKYAHCNVTLKDLERLAELRLDEVDKLYHPVLNYARTNHDNEMLVYLRYLAQYLEINSESSDPWDYPTREDLDSGNERYNSLLWSISQERWGRLASRYRLLQMRILFHMGNYSQCRELWMKSGIRKPVNVFDRMTYGFYAGALFRLGQRAEAAAIYAQLGDAQSARFCLNSNSSISCLRRVVDSDVNSPMLHIMLTNFVNSVQETHDIMLPLDASETMAEYNARITYLLENDGYWNAYLNDFYSSITRPTSYARYHFDFTKAYDDETFKEEDIKYKFEGNGCFAVYNRQIDDFLALSASVLKKSNLQDAALWASARAYVLYMRGDHQRAWEEIKDVRSFSASTTAVADNARTIRILIATTLTDDAEMENELRDEMAWLVARIKADAARVKAESEANEDKYIEPIAYFTDVFNRILVHGLAAHYGKANMRSLENLCYYIAHNTDVWEEETNYHKFYQSQGVFTDRFILLSLDEQKAFYNFLFTDDAKLSPLKEYLKSLVGFDRNDFLDVIGTRCIMENRLEEATQWLEQLSLDYLRTQNIAPYAAKRDYHVEQWFKHVRLSDEEVWPEDDVFYIKSLKRNVKLEFCREVLRMRSELTPLSGEARCKKAYELATMLFQASKRGDCWWLARYRNEGQYMSKADYYYLPEPPSAYDYEAEALRLVNDEVMRTSDRMLKSQALMARFYMIGNPPFKKLGDDYDYDKDYPDEEYIFDYSADSYMVFLELKEMLQKVGFDERINHCDVVVRCMNLD